MYGSFSQKLKIRIETEWDERKCGKMTLYNEIENILKRNNKTFADIETVILIDDIDSENSCVIPKECFIRISKETNYVNSGAGKKIENGLMLLGKDFRIERRELDNIDFSDSSGYFEFISYKIKIPEKINRNAKIWWE